MGKTGGVFVIYFTSDLHFYHDKIIKHVGRPFYTYEDMNQKLVDNWNCLIKAADEVYILGDIMMKGARYATEILSQLKGIKYLVRGNHDGFLDNPDFEQERFFRWVKDYHELVYQNTRFVLCHYPILEWNGFYKGAIHLHGHQHNHEDYNYRNLQQKIWRYDVGVDANYMKPVSAEDILDFFQMIEEIR